MIKFKNILQKASGESRAHAMHSFMLGASKGPGAAALAQDVAEEEPKETAAAEATAVAEEEPEETVAAFTRDVVEEEPEETATAVAQGAEEEPGITDELVTSVLDDMFPSGASETADDEPAYDEAVEESASGPAEEAVDPEWASEGAETHAAKEALLDDGAQVIFEQETPSEETWAEATPAEDVAQDVFEDGRTLEAASDVEAPGEGVPAEDTVVLFDQISEAAEGDLDAEAPSGEETLEESASTAPEEDTVESMISDAFAAIDSPPEPEPPSEEAAQPEEAAPGLDQKFMSEVDRLLTEFGQVEEESPAQETAESEDDDVSMQITKIEEEMAAIATQAGTADKEAALEESPKGEAEGESAEEEEDFADTLSPEEREALFAEGPDAQVSLPGDATASGASGELAEVELDFTPDTVGLSAPAEEAPPEDDEEDLLSRVLSDLDRLGDVSKPEATSDAADTADEDEEEEEIDDFSNILDEINAEEGQVEAAPVKETAVAPPPQKTGVKAEVLNKNDEQLIDEALNAGDESVDVDGLGDVGSASPSDTGDDQAKPEEGATAEAPEEADEKAAAQEADDPGDDADDGAREDEDSGLQDHEALLASLQASMDAAKDVDEDADDSDREEEAIRDEVLSRSKEVEQKVLDDVFGSNKDFRAELKAEMNQRDNADAGHADQSSALAVESRRLADERAASGEDMAMAVSLPTWVQNLDWAVWAAYQINRPFQRFLNPERLKLLSNIVMALLVAASAWLAVAIMLFFQGS